MNACNNPDDTFLNANLDEMETTWANEAMSDLCQESIGYCCPNLGSNGDNTIIIVSELPNNYAGMQSANREQLGGWSSSIVSILDADFIVNNERMFQNIVKHEMIHHCTHKGTHLESGNIMSSVGNFPIDGKLTDADVEYLTN